MAHAPHYKITLPPEGPVELPEDLGVVVVRGLPRNAVAVALPSGESGGSAGSTDGLTNTQLRAAPVAVSASALPLPSGAATEASLSSANDKLGSDGADAPAIAGTGIRGWLRAIFETVAGTLAVNIQNATVAVTGTFWQATQPVSATALPLPTGAATETTLAAANTNLGTDGASAPAITGTGVRGWLRGIYEKLSATLAVSIQNSSVAVTGTFWQATQPVSIATNTPDVTDRAGRALGVVTGPLTNTELRAAAVPVSGTFFQATQPVSMATNTPDVTDRAGRLLGVVTGPLTDAQLRAAAVPVSMATNAPDVTDRAARQLGVTSLTGSLPAGTNAIGALLGATLCVTAVSAANAAVTATLPLVAGQFHYISRIIIERVATTAIAGTAVLTYTSTNLNGWARTTGNAAPVGQQMKDVDDSLGPELRSQVAGTATTIVAPAAGATGIVRITVYYRTAA